MHQGARVHRHEDLRLRRIGEDVARVFLRHAHLRELVVNTADLFHQCLVLCLGLWLLGNGRRRDVLEAVRGDVALRLLVIRGDAVAHELMRQDARDTLDAESEGSVLKRRAMTDLDHLADHLAYLLLAQALCELLRTRRRVAEACGHGHDALRLRRVVE